MSEAWQVYSGSKMLHLSPVLSCFSYRTLIGMPTAGSGPSNGMADACLTSLSASSLPEMSRCPDTQARVTLFRLAPYHFLKIYVNIILPSAPRLHVPNLMPILRCLDRTKVSVQARGKCELFITWQLDGKELLVSRPNHKMEDLPLSAARDCLFNIQGVTGGKDQTSGGCSLC